MRTIGVVTVARSDYGIYLPVLRRIEDDPDLRLHLIVAGMHLSPEFGNTHEEIAEDGFDVADRIEMLLSSDSPEGIAKSMGVGTAGFAQSFARRRPDMLLVLGDRFEMHSAVVASLPFNIPIAHIHGGESTEGLIDESIRHSITKMSHLHFVSTEAYARRVIQMGEAPWRVTVTGAPSLDNIRTMRLSEKPEPEIELEHERYELTLLVTLHPVTLKFEETDFHVGELLAALSGVEHRIVFTYPNADTHGRRIIEKIKAFTQQHHRAIAVANLGVHRYFSLMAHVDAMVGNSSSGIIEAASFRLPVVNIGERQRGRVHAGNVIDVGYGREEIAGGIREATTPAFRARLNGMVNPYGDGNASERILERLKDIRLDDTLLLKRFHDIGMES